jgi:integrase
MLSGAMGTPETEGIFWMKRGTPTRYPGVLRIDENTICIRARTIDPRTGKKKEISKLLEGASAQEAAQKRAELLDAVKKPIGTTAKVRVGDFAKSWIESKALKLDAGTMRTYTDALENHVLPALGDYYYDAISSQDVQKWIDRAVQRGWMTEARAAERKSDKRDKAEKKGQKPERRAYSRHSVAVWFRVFRTMTRDAMVALNLQRDPTLRVSLPEAPPEPEESNSLTPDQLAAFLDAMRANYPQHHALVVLLAYTGLRFCHGSALRWEDWDEAAGVIRLVRKQVRGEIGPVSRKKRAPKQLPVEPELAEVLKAHRRRMLAEQVPGLSSGWMFPSSTGTLRTPSSVDKAWDRCLELAKIGKRFTVHGLRYTFTDLVRRANVDAVVRRALTGHVTEEMQRKYSTVGLDEKRAAVAGVIRLVPPERSPSAATAAAAIEVGPTLEAGTAVGLEVGPALEAGRAVGPEVGPNVVPLRLVPPVSAVVTAEVGPEVGPSHRKQKRPAEAML